MNNLIKILHLPRNPTNQAWIISRAQRKLGYISDMMVLESKIFDAGYDYNFNLQNYPNLLKYLVGSIRLIPFFIEIIRYYDVFHIHYKSILPLQLDTILLKKLNKKIFFSLHGCDVRLDCPHPYCQKIKEKKIRLIKTIKEVANGAIVLTPDLLEFVPEAKFIPQAINLDEWKPIESKENEKNIIRILHAPTDRFIKGTDIILKVLNDLKKEGYNIQIILIENIPRNEVKKYYLKADIVIDQIILGWYGTFAVECMALGKPVCAYIRDDLKKFAKGCPIVNVNAENIKEKLIKLMENKRLRKKISEKSINYVNKIHDSLKIAKKIIDFYNSH